jgi:hypothetical protein
VLHWRCHRLCQTVSTLTLWDVGGNLLVFMSSRVMILDAATAMSPSASELDALKTVINFSQSLSQWSVLLIGGSVAALLGTSNWRPRRDWMRKLYLLFAPALGFLFASAYYGVAAQRNCLALMLFKNPDARAISELNGNLRWQLTHMQIGFCFLGIWFAAFVFWWVFDRTIDVDKKG